MGHAVAAWAGGYRVTSFGIGTGKPLLLLRLPRNGTLFYMCRSGLHFSGVTWVYFPRGAASRVSDLVLACGGALTNALIAIAAATLLASFERQAVPFLTVWVPTVVLLLVNSVLALLFFLPRRTLRAEQGTLPSDGLQALVTLFPARFRRSHPGNSVAPLRTLLQRRAFWESIGDTAMLCVALIRAAETYRELGDIDFARALWKELSALKLVVEDEAYQRAWVNLLGVTLGKAADPVVALAEAGRAFQSLGNKSGTLRVERERVPRPDRDASLAALQVEAQKGGDAPFAFSLLADRIDLAADLLLDPSPPEKRRPPELAGLERLASQYDAARLEQESGVTDVRIYAQIARVRAMTGDDGGAAIAYERALSAAHRVFVALAFAPEAQSRYAARQAALVAAAMQCCHRLGREADAERYARLLT